MALELLSQLCTFKILQNVAKYRSIEILFQNSLKGILPSAREYWFKAHHRLMTMSPLYPCGKPCSRGTHNETVKNPAYLLHSIMIQLVESALNDSRSSVQRSFLGKKMQ